MRQAALVTGGARRIGRHIVERLAREGYAVAIHCNRSSGEAEGVAARIRSAGGEAVVVQADLVDGAAVDGLVDAASAALGPLTLLVNSASIFEPDERPKAIASVTVALGLGLPLGPIVGGWLLEHVWWGSVFLINVPLGLLAAAGVAILLPPSRAGNLRALGVTTPQRSALAPDLPALAETLPGFDAAPFNYIAATGGTPAPVVAKLNEVITGILNDPAFRERMAALGEEPTPSSPEELAQTIRAESARWKQVIETAGIRAE